VNTRPRLTAAQIHPGLRTCLARIRSVQSIDALALYEWTLPRLESLRMQFYACDRPATDFPIWVREQFLAGHGERA
jgi:hypothetical protein